MTWRVFPPRLLAAMFCFAAPHACDDEPIGREKTAGGRPNVTEPDASIRDGSGDSPPDANIDADAEESSVSPAPGMATVVTCPGWPLPALEGASCAAEGSAGAGVRLRGTVLAPNEVFRGGEVLISAAGNVLCAACDCSHHAEAAAAAKVTCPQGVISPGLINTHDHITFAGVGPVAHGYLRYRHRHDWRLGLRGHAALDVPGSASTKQVLAAELRGILAGTTSTIGGGGRRGFLRNLDVADLKEGLLADTVESDTFPLDDASGVLQTSGCAYGARPTTAAAVAATNAYVAHVAEGIDLEARNELTCAGPLALDLLAPQTALIHAIAATAREAEVLASERSWIVWSPRSNLDLYGNTAPVTLFDRLGIGIALGTDWLASGSMNLLRELRCADELNQQRLGRHFSDFELWRMVTTNAAFVAGVEGGLGLIAPGQAADLAVFDGRARTDHRAVIAAEPADVVLVLRGGRPLYGDRALMESAALGAADCEALSVCDSSKLVCSARDTGVALTDLTSAVQAVYPLFFCGAPDPEPSCVPLRSGEYDGGLGPGDADGDGVIDAADRCPELFDPRRPLDGTEQADSDGDGRGDACDLCPLDSGDGCAPVSSDDLDRDTIANGRDNCPEVPNPDQLDSDTDRHGDACDWCASPNPGFLPCPLPAQAVRDRAHPDHPAPGSKVALSGMVVTALRTASSSASGFYIEHPSREPFSGIFVYTGARPPAVGSGLWIAGRYQEYFGLDELTEPLWSIEDPATVVSIEPIDVAPADVATGGALAEAYESMLVRVMAVVVTNINPDSPNDYDELEVTGNLRIDDRLLPDLDNAYPVGTGFVSITGILDFSFGNAKLLPRSAADLVAE
jgi:hypothetical protein